MSKYNFQGLGGVGDAIEQDFLRQLALRRQAAQDDLNRRNVESEIADRSMNRNIQQANLDSLSGQRAALEEQRKASGAKDVANMMTPDQEIDPESESKLRAGGLGGLVIAGPKVGGHLAPEVGEGPTVDVGPDKFRGTPAQIKERDDRAQRQKYVDSLDPNSLEGKAARYEQETGKNAPTGMFDKTTRPPGAVGEYEYYVQQEKDAGRTPISFDAYQTRDANRKNPKPASNLGNDNRLDRSYQFNSSALEKLSKPIEDQMGRMERLRTTVNQATPQADALIAPELLTVMAGGQGSGLRMNEAEISRIVGGRSNLENLKASLNKWQLDPSKALSVTPDQRGQIKNLIDEVYKRGTDQIGIIDDARSELVGAGDVTAHRQIVADVHKKLRAPVEAIEPVSSHTNTPTTPSKYKVTVQ